MVKIKPLSRLELSAFCTQMAMLLESGTSARQGLELMLSDTKDKASAQVLNSIARAFDEGCTFSQSLEKSGVFPIYMCKMVDIGEVSGNLDKVMNSLSVYYEREHDISESIKGAVRYPLVMIAMMAVVIGVMVSWVLPVFSQVYSQLGSQMSAVSQSIMNLSQLFSKYSVLFVAALVLAGAFYLYCTYTEKGKPLGRKFLKGFPLTKEIYHKTARARFASALSLMLSSGIDTQQSLEKVKTVTEDEELSDKIDSCIKLMDEGESLEGSLGKSQLLGEMYARLAAIGFKTGNSDKIMQKIAADYAKAADEETDKKVSVIEPVMVAVFSVAMGLILLSVILPLMGVMSAIG